MKRALLVAFVGLGLVAYGTVVLVDMLKRARIISC